MYNVCTLYMSRYIVHVTVNSLMKQMYYYVQAEVETDYLNQSLKTTEIYSFQLMLRYQNVKTDEDKPITNYSLCHVQQFRPMKEHERTT